MILEEEKTTKDDYERMLGQIYPLLKDRIKASVDKELHRQFLKKVVEVSERSLRSLLYGSLQFDFSKKITEGEIEFWLEKTSLIFISYSYFCEVSVKEWFYLSDIYLKDISFKYFFRDILGYYNKVFSASSDWDDIEYYGAGYEEAIERRDKVGKEELKKILEKDYRAAGAELLAGVFGEDIEEEKEKGIFLGKWIKESFFKMIVPHLEKITEAKESLKKRPSKK